LPWYERYPAAHNFFQFPPTEKFFSSGPEKFAVLSFCVEPRTQEIDAKSITAAKLTPVLPDKETGFRDLSLRGQGNTQQEVDQEEDRVIPVLSTFKTTTSCRALSTLRASLHDASLCHDFVGAGNRFPVVVEKHLNSLVAPESAPVHMVKRLCLVDLLRDHFPFSQKMEGFLMKLT
jgi:hypothetical protein